MNYCPRLHKKAVTSQRGSNAAIMHAKRINCHGGGKHDPRLHRGFVATFSGGILTSATGKKKSGKIRQLIYKILQGYKSSSQLEGEEEEEKKDEFQLPKHCTNTMKWKVCQGGTGWKKQRQQNKETRNANSNAHPIFCGRRDAAAPRHRARPPLSLYGHKY